MSHDGAHDVDKEDFGGDDIDNDNKKARDDKRVEILYIWMQYLKVFHLIQKIWDVAGTLYCNVTRAKL